MKAVLVDYIVKENKHESNFKIFELEDVSLIEVNHMAYDVNSLNKGDSVTIFFKQKMEVSKDRDFRNYSDTRTMLGEAIVLIGEITIFNEVFELKIDSFEVIKLEEVDN